MENSIRKPLQGVRNIIRFNWHYYTLSASLIVLILFIQQYFGLFNIAATILILLILLSIIISLFVSAYIYDFSDLYKFEWLTNLKQGEKERLLNINAGFDETSGLIRAEFKTSELIVADFYDPLKHTEISIKRARKAYPPFPNTQQVSTTHLPLPDNSRDKIFTIFSAHEIRNDEERVAFFKELKRVLNTPGEIIVTEHLRDTANFFAYNIGFFHFYPKSKWLKTFRLAGLNVTKVIKTTPFITTFILEKNGAAS